MFWKFCYYLYRLLFIYKFFFFFLNLELTWYFFQITFRYVFSPQISKFVTMCSFLLNFPFLYILILTCFFLRGFFQYIWRNWRLISNFITNYPNYNVTVNFSFLLFRIYILYIPTYMCLWIKSRHLSVHLSKFILVPFYFVSKERKT